MYNDGSNDNLKFSIGGVDRAFLSASQWNVAGNLVASGSVTGNGWFNGVYISGSGIGDGDSSGNQRIGGEGRQHLGGYMRSYGGNALGKLEFYTGTTGTGSLALKLGSGQNATFSGYITVDGDYLYLGGRHGLYSNAGNDWLYLTDENGATYTAGVSRIAGTESYWNDKVTSDEWWSTAGSSVTMTFDGSNNTTFAGSVTSTNAGGQLIIKSGSSEYFRIHNNDLRTPSGTAMHLQTNGSTNALILGTDQTATFAGTIYTDELNAPQDSHLTMGSDYQSSKHIVINGASFGDGGSGNLSIAQLSLNSKIEHTGDTSTQINLETSQMTLQTSGGCAISLNNDENIYLYTGTSGSVALELANNDATFYGSVNVNSISSRQNNEDFTITADGTGKVKIDDDSHITGDLQVSGFAELDSGANIDGSTTITGNVNSSGNILANGTGTQKLGTHNRFYYGTISDFDEDEYFYAFSIQGGLLNNIIRLSLKGTSNNHLHSHLIYIQVNHYQDIQVKSWSGDYNQVYMKITSDGNENFDVQLKSSSTGDPTTLHWNVQTFTSDTELVENGSALYSTITHNHTTKTGTVMTGRNGASTGVAHWETDGNVQIGASGDTSHKLHVDGLIGTSGSLHLNSSQGINWAHGDASIVEGQSSNYALDFYNYDGTGNNLTLSLNPDHTATFAGRVYIQKSQEKLLLVENLNTIDSQYAYMELQSNAGNDTHGSGVAFTDSNGMNATSGAYIGSINNNLEFNTSASSPSNNVRLKIASGGDATFYGEIGLGDGKKIHGDSATLGYAQFGSSTGAVIAYDGGNGKTQFKCLNGNVDVWAGGGSALAIDSSKNATFAGRIIANGTGAHVFNGAIDINSTNYLFLGGWMRINNPGSGAFKLGQYNGSSWSDTLDITNAGNATFGGSIFLADNGTVNLGTGTDYQLWHNGSHSYIYSETGNMYYQQNSAGASHIFETRYGGGSKSSVFEVTDAGISVTQGNATFGGNVAVSGNISNDAGFLKVEGTRDSTKTIHQIGHGATGNGVGDAQPYDVVSIRGYSIEYPDQSVYTRLANVGFLHFHATGSWTGNARQFALTNGYNMGGGGGPRFALLYGSSTTDMPDLGASGGLGTNTNLACYWDKDGNFTQSKNLAVVGTTNFTGSINCESIATIAGQVTASSKIAVGHSGTSGPTVGVSGDIGVSGYLKLGSNSATNSGGGSIRLYAPNSGNDFAINCWDPSASDWVNVMEITSESNVTTFTGTIYSPSLQAPQDSDLTLGSDYQSGKYVVINGVTFGNGGSGNITGATFGDISVGTLTATHGDFNGTEVTLHDDTGVNYKVMGYGFFGSTQSGHYAHIGFNTRSKIGTSNAWEVANGHGSCGFADMRMKGYGHGIEFHCKDGAVSGGTNNTTGDLCFQIKPTKEIVGKGDLTISGFAEFGNGFFSDGASNIVGDTTVTGQFTASGNVALGGTFKSYPVNLYGANEVLAIRSSHQYNGAFSLRVNAGANTGGTNVLYIATKASMLGSGTDDHPQILSQGSRSLGLGVNSSEYITIDSSESTFSNYIRTNADPYSARLGGHAGGFEVRSNSTGSMGIYGSDSVGNFRFQIYGDGTNYGFLGYNWGDWDLKKKPNGRLYLNDNTTYYLQTDSTSHLYKVTTANDIQTGGTYKSSDGSSGITDCINFEANNGDDHTVEIKDGLIVDWTVVS